MKKLLYIVMMMPLVLFSCNQDEIPTFESEDAGIYFQTGIQQRFFLNIDAYWDSTRYSFSEADDAVTEHAENTTAIEGTHFTANLGDVVIPAGAAEVEVPITFKRTADLREKEIRLMLKVEDNENFKVPFTRQKNTNIYNDQGDTIMANRYLFLVNEFYSEPVLWSMFGEPVGTWTVKKQRLMTEMFELSAYDWSIDGWANGDGKVQSERFRYFAIKLHKYLQDLANAGTPVLEEDGSFMQLGPGYEVDYSSCM